MVLISSAKNSGGNFDQHQGPNDVKVHVFLPGEQMSLALKFAYWFEEHDGELSVYKINRWLRQSDSLIRSICVYSPSARALPNYSLPTHDYVIVIFFCSNEKIIFSYREFIDLCNNCEFIHPERKVLISQLKFVRELIDKNEIELEQLKQERDISLEQQKREEEIRFKELKQEEEIRLEQQRREEEIRLEQLKQQEMIRLERLRREEEIRLERQRREEKTMLEEIKQKEKVRLENTKVISIKRSALTCKQLDDYGSSFKSTNVPRLAPSDSAKYFILILSDNCEITKWKRVPFSDTTLDTIKSSIVVFYSNKTTGKEYNRKIDKIGFHSLDEYSYKCEAGKEYSEDV